MWGPEEVDIISEPSTMTDSMPFPVEKQTGKKDDPRRSSEAVDQRPMSATLRTVRKAGWRKYGQKRLSNNMVRSYYRCSIPGCSVKRQVVTSSEYDGMAQVRTIGEHKHENALGPTYREATYETQRVTPVSQNRKRKQPSKGSKGSDTEQYELEDWPPGTTKEENSCMPTSSSGQPEVTVDSAFTARLLECVPAFVVTDPSSDPKHRIVYTSPGFTGLTGYTADDSMGKSMSLLEGCKTDPRCSQRLSEIMSGEVPGRIMSLYYRKNGDPFWCLLNVAPIRAPGGDGKIVACVGNLLDISSKPDREYQMDCSQAL